MKSVSFGCDPEFFVSCNNKIVGGEKILKSNISSGFGQVTLDGVQIELNPYPHTCREIMGTRIRELIALFKDRLPESHKINYDVTVDIDKEELESLSINSQIFGCSPSLNFYTNKESVLGEDGRTYLKRSAGGHVHIEANDPIDISLIGIFDILVGNTCVLIDRDKGNVERRKLYGRAGEYRLVYDEEGHQLPKRIEYRTLSNFWLKGYLTMSLVFGLIREAYNIYYEKQDIFSLVDMNDIEKAINENDFDLAYENFNKIKKVFSKMDNQYYTLNNNLEIFDFFVKMGLDYWTNSWKDQVGQGLNNYGIERHLEKIVTPIMNGDLYVTKHYDFLREIWKQD